MRRFSIFFVSIGAISYAVPGSLYKMANQAGINSGQLVTALFINAAIILNILGIIYEKRRGIKIKFRQEWKVILAGTTMAITNTFYMTSLKYASVAVVAVMTMQSVWLAIVFAAIKEKRWPSKIQIIGVIIILIGTVLAAGLIPFDGQVSLLGMGLSFGSAVAYALTIQFTGHLGQDLPGLTKARLMSIGALGLILLIWLPQISSTPNFVVAIPWGIRISIFAMIIPLTMFSSFMQYLKLGVGPILSALELPFSVIFAFMFLGERVQFVQVIGVVIILTTIVLTNIIAARQTLRSQQAHLKKPQNKKVVK